MDNTSHPSKFLLCLLLLGNVADVIAELPVPCAACNGSIPWVTAGQATHQFNGNTLTVTQQSPKAVLNWQSFNIGANNAVHFNQQSGANAIALNRIYQGDPSRIFGALSATGQVYLVNQNGVVFGATSRVNVGALLATTLDISQQAVEQGIVQAINQNRPAFSAFVDGQGKAVSADIEIQAGAQLRSAQNGSVLIFAPRIENSGAITTPDGQTILAAGEKIYLMASSDFDLRGLVVEVDVDSVPDQALQNYLKGISGQLQRGVVTNRGDISTGFGNATLMGLAVNQQGRISATTSTLRNGSIRLLARDKAAKDSQGALTGIETKTVDETSVINSRTALPTRAGMVQIGNGSQTEITLSEGVDGAVPYDINTTLRSGERVRINGQVGSSIRVTGKKVVLESGSTLRAPSGEVSIIAQSDPSQRVIPGTRDESRVIAHAGSKIDVAGANIVLPVERNTVKVELRGNELRDNPAQRNGILRGSTVTVDIRRKGVRADGTPWEGTPLADISGALDAIPRGVQERSAGGGEINIKSQGEIVFNPSSQLNLAGGSISYPDGIVETSKLLSQGRIFDIADAHPSRVYEAVFGATEVSHTKWGVKESFRIMSSGGFASFGNGYREGGDAGVLRLMAPYVALNGAIEAPLTRGAFQRNPSTALVKSDNGIEVRSFAESPKGASLVLGDSEATLGGVLPDFRLLDLTFVGTTPSTIVNTFGDPTLRTIDLPSALFGNDTFESISIFSRGKVTLPSDVRLARDFTGSFNTTANDILIAGDIDVANGSVVLTAKPTVVSPDESSSLLITGSAEIDLAGGWLNDGIDSRAGLPLSPRFTDGGTLKLSATAGAAEVAAGARISVDGGGALDSSGKIRPGRGGSFALAALPGRDGESARATLRGDVTGFGFSDGGKFELSTGNLCIANGMCSGLSQATLVSPNFFTDNGFADFSLTSLPGSLELSASTRLAPRQRNFALPRDLASRATARRLFGLETVLLEDWARAPSNLSLTTRVVLPAGTVSDSNSFMQLGNLQISPGAVISLDPGAKLKLSTNTRLTINGALRAPGGTIDVLLDNSLPMSEFAPQQALWVSGEAVLAAPSAFTPEPNVFGRRTGHIFSAGAISLSAKRGYVVAAPNSTLDVSGAAFFLDIRNTARGSINETFQPLLVDAPAGTVSVSAAEGVYLGANLRGSPSTAPGATGGSFELRLNAQERLDDSVSPFFPATPRTIALNDGALPILPGDAQASGLDSTFNGQALLTASSLANAGFDNMLLQTENLLSPSNALLASGRIELDSGVKLSPRDRLTLDAPEIMLRGSATLNANYLALGSSDRRTQELPNVVVGSGTLDASANLIDLVGALAINGTQRVALTASEDIRARGIQVQNQRELKGRLQSPAALTFTAAQIYPSTLSNYEIQSTGGSTSSITTLGNGKPAHAALAAGGSLKLSAQSITQSGVLKSPLGSLSFNAEQVTLSANSVTSTSLDGAIVPFGMLQGGRDWIYPLLDNHTLVFNGTLNQLPRQHLEFKSDILSVEPGALVDVRGGGALHAHEFLPGPGGSRDILANEVSANSYAILPSLPQGFAAFDSALYRESSLQPGAQITVGGSPSLAAGTYTLYPAAYASLPGALLVTEDPSFRDVQTHELTPRVDGSFVVAGRRTSLGTAAYDSRTQGYLIETGAQFAARAEYATAQADEFFTAAARDGRLVQPRLPRDAGSLVFDVNEALALRGSLLTASPTGAGANIDITATRIAVGDRGSALAGYLNVSAQELQRLGATSLLLGARRVAGSAATALSSVGQEVRIREGTALTAPDLIFAGRDKVTLERGATISTNAPTSPPFTLPLSLTGDGALVRASHVDAPSVLTRTGETVDPNARTGTLFIDVGASISTPGSLLLDASRDTVLDGALHVRDADLRFSAARISVGQAPSATGGLVLSPARLQDFAPRSFALASRGDLTFFSGANLNAETLSLSASTFLGKLALGESASITANSLSFEGTTTTAVAGAPRIGTLAINANAVNFNGGNLLADGFESVSLVADHEFVGSGQGTFTAADRLAISTPKLTGLGGSNVTLTASGLLSATGGSETASGGSDTQSFGAQMTLKGADLFFDTYASLPSGRVSLIATGNAGDVRVGANAAIDVAGRTRKFFHESVATGGGRVELTSAHGNAVVDGAEINLSGAGTAPAGALLLRAPEGRFVLSDAQRLRANSQSAGGTFVSDTLDAPNFSALLNDLAQAGFSGEQHFRVRQGDLIVALTDAISANQIKLVADNGGIQVNGTLNARGIRPGRVSLLSRDTINLGSQAKISAIGTNHAGGSVEIFAGSSAAANTAAGSVFSASGSVIDVGSSTNLATGSIAFRLPRASLQTLSTATNADDRMALNGELRHAREVVIEGYETYLDTAISGSELNPVEANARFTSARDFVANTVNILNTLNLPTGSIYKVRPGIEIRSTGDLAVGTTSGTASWDLLGWRFNSEPGVLTLRAARNLNFNQSLTDGVLRDANRDIAQAGPSWSYRLAAGSDLSSADPMAVQVEFGAPLVAGDLVVAGGTVATNPAAAPSTFRAIRTGTGKIEIAAARDLTLTNRASVIYTAGSPVTNGSVLLPELGLRNYAADGGDIRIMAGRDINGAASNQLPSSWLFRAGRLSGTGESSTGWTVAMERFEQNIGALAGGDVSVSAGRTIRNLSVNIPTIGRQTGGVTAAENQLDIMGGGDLTVTAGADILSGAFFVGRGQGEIRARGSIDSGRSVSTSNLTPLHTILSLGEGSLVLEAGRGLKIESVNNPTALPQSRAQNATNRKSFFFTYANDSAVTLSALAGNVSLVNNASGMTTALSALLFNAAASESEALVTYAPTLQVNALDGAIEVGGQMSLFPAPKGNLGLNAWGDLTFNAGARVLVSDADKSLLGTPYSPQNAYGDIAEALEVFAARNANHAAVPTHSDAAQPDGIPDRIPVTLLSENGSVRFEQDTAGNTVLGSAKATRIQAKQDVFNLRLIAQHLRNSDVSLVRAGGDIVYSNLRTPEGALQLSSAGVVLDGPGELSLIAGGDVDFQTAVGVETRGNQVNAALPEQGATVAIIAGLAGTEPNFEAFAARYLASLATVPGKRSLASEADALEGFLESRSVSAALQIRNAPSENSAASDARFTQALSNFNLLTDVQKQPYLRGIFFDLLRDSGREAANSGSADFSVGYSAIATLFPPAAFDGDINLVFSKIKTLDGGDIHLLAPGGDINAGLATPPTGLGQRGPADLGIVIQAVGDLFTFSAGDLLINESRAFVGDGGDILMWASDGNIDAGRGAKTAVSAPPPILTINEQGQVNVTFPAALTGSGIRAFVTTPGKRPGSVDLFAPRGVVDAGDAGIGSAGNITIAATAVLGADNISVGGTSTGVPSAAVSVPVGLASTSAAASSATKSATSGASSSVGNSDGNSITKDLASSLASLISVQVIGFGE